MVLITIVNRVYKLIYNCCAPHWKGNPSKYVTLHMFFFWGGKNRTILYENIYQSLWASWLLSTYVYITQGSAISDRKLRLPKLFLEGSACSILDVIMDEIPFQVESFNGEHDQILISKLKSPCEHGLKSPFLKAETAIFSPRCPAEVSVGSHSWAIQVRWASERPVDMVKKVLLRDS